MDYTRLSPKEIERLAYHITPGAWAVDRERPFSTLLGSCVSVCLYDPKLKIGGMNHFMLPQMQRSRHGDVDSLLAGDFAMEVLLNTLLQQGAVKSRLQAKAFGGGTVIQVNSDAMRIGSRNVTFTREWLEREGIPLISSDFLGPWSRKLLFLPATGDAYCRRMLASMATATMIEQEERLYAQDLLNPRGGAASKKIEIF